MLYEPYVVSLFFLLGHSWAMIYYRDIFKPSVLTFWANLVLGGGAGKNRDSVKKD